eukprot:47210_1
MTSMHRLNKLIEQLQPPDSITESKSNACSNSQFEYTVSDSMLTAEQRKSYEKNGFIVIKKLLTPPEVEKYYNRFDELCANPQDGSPAMIIMRDVSLGDLKKKDRKTERVVTKLQMWAYDRVLWTYPTNKRVVPYLESIIGQDIRACHFMSINKPPDPGLLSSRHPLHQDQWYFPFAPSKHIVCSWTALQHINRNNGCLVVVPGTHKWNSNLGIGGKLLPHGYPKAWHGPVNKAYHGLHLPDDMDINTMLSKRVHLEMEPGDTVFFHPLLFHGSGANLSGKNRRSISTHYCNPTKVDFLRGGVIPEQSIIATEVEEMAKKMAGFTVTFDQVWKRKSRQVQGDVGSFR